MKASNDDLDAVGAALLNGINRDTFPNLRWRRKAMIIAALLVARKGNVFKKRQLRRRVAGLTDDWSTSIRVGEFIRTMRKHGLAVWHEGVVTIVLPPSVLCMVAEAQDARKKLADAQQCQLEFRAPGARGYYADMRSRMKKPTP